MEDLIIVIVPPLLGVGFYALIAWLSKRNKLAIFSGIALFVSVILFFFITSRNVTNEGFLALGYFLMALLASYALLAYLFAWGFDYFKQKRKTY